MRLVSVWLAWFRGKEVMSDFATSAAGTNALHVCIAISESDRANTAARGQNRRR